MLPSAKPSARSALCFAAASAAVGYVAARRMIVASRRALSSTATTRAVPFETLDVFTAEPFGGNPLAVIFDGEARLSDKEMQLIASEFGYSETTVVLPPKDPANTACVRIFSPTAEMPFAGHPNVGTATALAWRGEVFGKKVGRTVRLEELAGIVPLDILMDNESSPTGAMLTAPEQFAIPMPSLPKAAIAACIGLDESHVVTTRHPPLVATCGLPFILVELSGLDALSCSHGVGAAFTAAPLAGAPPKVLAYVRMKGSDEGDIRCRMHRADGSEDAGTGSANCALMGLLAALASPPPAGSQSRLISASILQGVEMGRPSRLLGEAERLADSGEAGITDAVVGAVRIGGQCAPMMRGELLPFVRPRSP